MMFDRICRAFLQHQAKVEAADMYKKVFCNVGMAAMIGPVPTSDREQMRKCVFVVLGPRAEKTYAALQLFCQDHQLPPDKNIPGDMQKAKAKNRFIYPTDIDHDSGVGCILQILIEIAILLFFLIF